jgi:hypothetical protein
VCASSEPAGWRPPRSEGLVRAGFNLFGCISVPEYDRLRCDARRAWVIGPEHACSEAAEAHHMAQVPWLQTGADGAC